MKSPTAWVVRSASSGKDFRAARVSTLNGHPRGGASSGDCMYAQLSDRVRFATIATSRPICGI